MVINIFYDRQCRFVSRRLTYLTLVLIVFVYTFSTRLFPTVVPVEAFEDTAKRDASNKIKDSVSGFRDSLTQGAMVLNPFKDLSMARWFVRKTHFRMFLGGQIGNCCMFHCLTCSHLMRIGPFSPRFMTDP